MFSDGATARFDLADLPCPQLAHDLVAGLVELIHPHGTIDAAGSGNIVLLEVRTDQGTPVLGGPRQRALLARLALEPGRTVSVDALVEDLWGEEPPPTAVKMIHVAVSQLRKVLPDGVLEGRVGDGGRRGGRQRRA